MKEELNWDFKGENTKEYTHGFHTYPAMMIPQVARRLIEMYGENANILLDPFCGSGTSLVEASLRNHINEAYGFDLNPLAVLMTKVKTTPLNPEKLKLQLKRFFNTTGSSNIPQFKNIEFWFKPKVIERLSVIKNEINKIQDKDIRDFFLVCFSETVRDVSNTRNKEFKLYRMDKENLEKFDPDVFAEFEENVLKNINGMKDYIKERKTTKTNSDIVNVMGKLPLNEGSVNIIVTSPPYGDSRTTVAYGQFSRLALQWLGYEEINGLDNEMLGGRPTKDLEIKIGSPTLKGIIKKIAEKDEKRAREVLSFYQDFDKCVLQLHKVMAKNGIVCFVVGNRTVKGINIPTDKIMAELFHSHGEYEDIATHTRAIPNKRMPKENSPTNIKGEKVTTMNNEFIFILKKI